MAQRNDPRTAKAKEFRLSRYFSITCLVGIGIVIAALSIFNRQLAVSALIEHETRADVSLAQAMANTIWPEYAQFVQGASRIPKEALPHRQEIAALRNDILQQMKGLNVVKVKIYNLDGLTVFSTDPSQIGDDKSQNRGFMSAKAGDITSELTFRKEFSAFEQVIVDRNVLSPYIPIRKSKDSPVEGVFEIYSDVTELVDRLEQTQWRIVGGVLSSLLILYIFLFLMVRRADGIINTANEKIVTANNQLEARVEERTAELREAMEQAQSASIAKSQFLANMSHEIRTPINGVLGNTELLLDSALNEKQKRTATMVLQSGEALLNVINDILDFSKVEAGKLDLDSTPFELRPLVEDLGKLFAEPAHRKGLELTCDVANASPNSLRGDPGRLRQVLINLIGNAVKFTDEGEVLVRVTSVAAGDDAATFRFEVKDTGPGIETALHHKIFDSFSQADGSMTRRYGGSGLGLTISKQLIELMGGTIGLDSTPGDGSTFSFIVDLQREPEIAGNNANDLGMLGELKVLIVVHKATNRDVLRQQLIAWGVEHQCVKRGPEALETLRGAAINHSPFDVVLVDKQIPGMDGTALARAIGADAAIADTRVIMLTSVYDELATDVGDGVIEWSCLTKPVRQSELAECLLETESDVAEARSNVSRDSLPPAAPGKRFVGCILVVDDNAINQSMAQDMLQGMGCRVDVAGNGRRALEMHAERRYDLILMDCQMPVLDGFAATRGIRNRERDTTPAERVPIVAVTANAMDGDREHCLQAGMDDYLAKPFNQMQLSAVLEQWLDGEDGGSDREAATTATAQPATSELAATVLDQTCLDNIRGLRQPGAPDPLAKYIDLFLRDAPALLGDLRSAVAAANADALVKCAHSLKSDSASLGAVTLARHCRQLEEQGRTHSLADATAVLDELEFEYDKARAALVLERGEAA